MIEYFRESSSYMKAEDYYQFLDHAWHQETARNSLDRWVDICNQEKWEYSNENMEILVRVFGASWYFTRFIFVYGNKIDALLEVEFKLEDEFKIAGIQFEDILKFDEIEQAINQLRLFKNAIMFKILIAYLMGTLNLESIELALTRLSEKILTALIQVLEKKTSNLNVPISILGMGRMAGNEMTFGSDLDLIFLYEKNDHILNPDLSSIIRLLLRLVAQPSSNGQLYEVDMRLRPHGNSGPLVSTYQTFLKYHAADREIWERQMMTRCRPVLVQSSNIDMLMSELNDYIYAEYADGVLEEQIVTMRRRVENVLGSVRNKHEIKRGAGGLMDIDFITHFFQLRYGIKEKVLQTASTRDAIRQLENSRYINNNDKKTLLDSYEFLKQAETALRLFDLKSVDSFPSDVNSNVSLAKAMGFGNNVDGFMDKYLEITAEVRQLFIKLVGDLD